MEILNSQQLTDANLTPFLFILAICICMGTFVAFVETDKSLGAWVSVIIIIISIIFLFKLPWTKPIDQWRYTVEITDETKYKELIDNGYKFSSPIYKNREIYYITGDEMK